MLFISAWASRCFVQQSRAMRRPPGVERATETVPRFFVFPNLNTLFIINQTESGTVGPKETEMKKYYHCCPQKTLLAFRDE